MTDNNLYKSLIEIGFEDYLKKRGGGNIYFEPHMEKINFFVNNLSDKQKKVLKDKTDKKKNETHTQHNDVFHEISIACAFYDKVYFLQETDEKTPDFCSNDIYVEVKTINNSDVERKRLDELDKGPICEISPALNQGEVEKIKKEFIDCVGKKFKDHIETAKKQLNSRGGHIWVVYAIDSPPKFHEKINTAIENKFDEIIKELSSELHKSNICVKYMHFESLREKIAS
jgi:hypothetical protein